MTSLAQRPIESAVAGYYASALARHGRTHRGVDWSSDASQRLRFEVLLGGVDWSRAPTVLDVGCGYGALVAYLDELGVACDYTGYDISCAMVDAARRTVGEREDRRFTTDLDALEPADVVVASGIFNVKLDIDRSTWTTYVGETISRLGALTRRHLAFNMLPAASSPELERADLYYANPGAVARYCRSAIGGAVDVRDGYGLWEFSVVVRPAGDA